MDKIIIFDTTLRDGEQAPGASLNAKEKMEIAQQLVRVGADVIEAGFPISSPGDFASVKEIATKIKGATICGLARAIKKDIDAAYMAVKPAKSARIHVFLATSKIHMQYKLKKAEGEILRLTEEMVKYARKRIGDIQFSPEDASRTEKDFLFKVVETAINAGATTINIPDTVGYAEPEEFGILINDIMNNVPNVNKAVIAVHCHNDLGLAVANSLSAIRNGARQVECTINGIGERAGNASMEEIVMAIKTRKDLFSNVTTVINTKEIYKTSRMVSKLTGFVVAPNKAIVGGNAFRHESGIHQDGVLKKRTTYEIIDPDDVGFTGEGLVLGKHSGRHAFKERLESLGIRLNDKELDKAFGRFKVLADKKKTVYDEDLISIVEDEFSKVSEVWQLNSLQITSGTNITPTASVKLKSKGKFFASSSSGDGPVDACYKAIDKITKVKGELLDYSIQAVTRGKDALGEVSIKIRAKNQEVAGRGASTDILEASAKAYLNAINRVLSKTPKSTGLTL
ncbi:MAG: 2-isopropylmalate synthase [Candidatus Omnitrophica bacterium]|nr:2-isopropylmalate synthase [Candidatus Omnitrophota bacterium]